MTRPRAFPALILTIAMTIAVTLAGGAARATDLGAMTDAERAAFRAEVRAYLLDNPEVILEAVNILDQRQAEAKNQADLAMVTDNADEIFNDGYSWVGGNPDGDITLVEFFDYRCAYCRRSAPEIATLMQGDGNIRLILKEFPILGEASLTLSRFAIATRNIAGPDAYKEMHDTLINFTGEPTRVALRRLAEGFGLDADAILAAMSDEKVDAEIGRNHALAQRMQINGTPTFVLQDEMLRGFLPADQMAAIVAQKRAAEGG